MTKRMTITIYLVIGALVAVGLFATGLALGEDGADEPQQVVQEFTCADGQWSDATIAGNDGSLSSSVHADLPNDGRTIEVTGSGGRKITTHSDGRVEGEGGELTVTCSSPTH